MDIVIRKMEERDLDRIMEIEKDAFTIPWPKNSFLLELTKNQLARYIVAVEDEKIVGYIGSWYIIDEAHIINVAVHKEHRGKHIGDKLMSCFIEKCEKDDIDSITLEVRKSNEIAKNLYKKYGFKPGGIRKEYYKDNKEDAIIMWKQVREVI